MELLATTNPGLEAVAADEVADLVGADARRRYRGAITFEADGAAVYRLNRWSRTLHRVQPLVVDATFEDLDGIADLVAAEPIDRYFDPGQTFGVRPTRHGTHGFTSVDVGDRTGQAVVDAVRDATGSEPAVDLDDPDVIFRAFVRDDEFLFAVDATGAESLHRRWYRECEHNAPLRPTFAAAMVRLAGFEPGDGLVDPTCGSATIPIEAALAALGRPPHRDREYADEWLSFLEPGSWGDADADSAPEGDATDPGPGSAPAHDPDPDHDHDHDRRDPETPPTLRGIDVRERWVRCARINAEAAGVEDVVDVECGDATEADLSTDVVVGNLPYGIRTVAGDLRTLYRDLSANLRDSEWRTAVLLTTRADLLELPVERTIPVRLGRLEAEVVVARR